MLWDETMIRYTDTEHVVTLKSMYDCRLKLIRINLIAAFLLTVVSLYLTAPLASGECHA